MSRYLVTGAAGFIGYHVAERLLARGEQVVGLDSVNDYYDVSLKEARLARLAGRPNFEFVRGNLADRTLVESTFARHAFDVVINLAAQAGVRYSLQNPHAYIDANIVGFMNILEGCRHADVQHLVYASSSSVYGKNEKYPSQVTDPVDHPISLYAATKKSNELMAHTYSHLFGLPTTGLRFFTVYGPWGRPDMALFLFTRAILDGKPIDVFNEGKMRRDFTFIDDIVEGVLRTADRIPSEENAEPDSTSQIGCYRLYNIGNDQPVELLEMIRLLETELGRTATMNLLPMQPGDVIASHADVSDLRRDVGFQPKTPLAVGIKKFVEWYRDHYREVPRS